MICTKHTDCVTIDHRERDLIKNMLKSGVFHKHEEDKVGTVNSWPLHVVELKLGDIIVNRITATHCKLQWLIERKTMSDLRASITDGRYSDQKSRMLELRKCHDPNLKMSYLFEGCVHDHRSDSMYTSIRGAITWTQHRDNFTTFHTRHVPDTVDLITYLLNAPIRKWEMAFPLSSVIAINVSSNLRTKYKSSKITMLARQLTCVRGVSITKARLLSTFFDTINDLVLFLGTDLVEPTSAMIDSEHVRDNVRGFLENVPKSHRLSCFKGIGRILSCSIHKSIFGPSVSGVV
jgi:ERCC4-type nuclease